MRLINILLALYFVTANIGFAEPKHVYLAGWTAATGLSDSNAPYLFCAPDQVFPQKNLFEHSRFFAGKYNDGVLIQGLDTEQILEWTRTKKTIDLNQEITEMVKASKLYTVRRSKVAGKLKVFTYTYKTSDVSIRQTYASCLEEGPIGWQCGTFHKNDPKACCEGASKLFGFNAEWSSNSPSPATWRIKFGYGNGSPVFALGARGKDEPIRFCHSILLTGV